MKKYFHTTKMIPKELLVKIYASGHSVDPSTAHWSLIINGLNGRMAVKKPFLIKGNKKKILESGFRLHKS